MRRYRIQSICFAIVLLLITATGCSDPDESAGFGLSSPKVVSVAPPDASDGPCPNTIVTATFNQAMNRASINGSTFKLTGPGTTPVIGVVSYDSSTDTAIFTPAAVLATGVLYTVTVTTGVQNLQGISPASNSVSTFTPNAALCQPPSPPLASAANFDVLGGSTVTNTGPTTITGGDLGLSPGSAITGFPPGVVFAATHIMDATAAQAELDATVAYNNLAALPGGAVLLGNLSGVTFTPGLYKNASTVTFTTGIVTLDAQGDPNAVFIFQIGSMLTTLGSTQVVLSGGAQAKNVFWQVGSSATLGTHSIFQGTILALQSITLDTGASLTGRALAINGAVTLDSNVITAP